MRLLLISNSTNVGEEFLKHSKEEINNFLTDINKVLFIPYAAVNLSFDDYTKKVQSSFDEFNIEVDSIHKHKNPKKAISEAKAIIVGGGNTFQLLQKLQFLDIIELVRYYVFKGTPYIGWSAGVNVTCPTIRTTNDMPIVEPDSFNAINLIRFQINPHYLDSHPEGHAGETREMRIQEFLIKNPDLYVVGLREGSMLRIENAVINLLGEKSVRIYCYNKEPKELKPGSDFDFLFE